ncbi:MAG TPA: HEAT repeat domain-containing protein, partial [Isosphaeraceae bacterium]|nr:HEAT repeat domain-containing protein [Isosphaeraceae bacterium]
AAGVGCLLICNDMLSKFFQATRAFNPLLTPLIYEGTVLEKFAKYKVGTSEAGLKQSVERGIAWIRQKYRPAKDAVTGQSMYYSLYGMERTGALAGDLMGSRTWWYDPGTVAVKSTQREDGSWDDDHGSGPNTSWAILFLVKSTAKTLRAIELRRLGAGTLIGGRNLPPDLTNLTIAQGRVVVKPMNGAVEGMLAVLEDPRALNAESALAGLVGRFQAEGPSALRPFKDRFRKLLDDRDPGIRRVACWGLGRTGDMDVAPDLIRALMDPSGDVVDEARVGLQVLSRKLDNLGPPRGASAEQKVAAARRWKEWYDSVRTPDLPPVEDARLNPAVPVAAPASADKAEGQE